jgi:hypothetical protein
MTNLYKLVGWKFLCALLTSMIVSVSALAGDYSIGVYYFPGWKDNQPGGPYEQPWEKIKPYADREPALGWYQEGSTSVMEQQLGWMKKYGIDYVIFDWYMDRNVKTHMDNALNAYLRASDRHGVKFAIMWANHTTYMFSKAQFEALFMLWARRYMFRPDYLQVDGKPVVYIFSAEVLNKNAQNIGMSSAELIAMADKIFKDEGLPGLSFIGGGGGGIPGLDYSQKAGYTGYSAYNFHSSPGLRFPGGRTLSHSYSELDQAYRGQWKWMLEQSAGIYVVPMTSGWDRRPWGGSKDPDHDESISDGDEFEAHLRAARREMDKAPIKTHRMGVVCCWNEFGEGSFIEPTKKNGFLYLEKIQKVFKSEK